MAKPDFSTYPKPARDRLLALRKMIMDVAKATPGVGRIEETLRWGQPKPTKYAMFFICTSGLIEDFKELYRDKMKFEGNRSIVFDVADRLPEEPLRHCISLALTYHLRKKQRASQK